MIFKLFRKHLYLQVMVAIIAGACVGEFYPRFGVELKFLADAFIKLIKMMVTPIIFTTVVVGFSAMGNLKRVGRIGLRAFVYFEVMTTLALIIGLVVAHVFQPGAGINASPLTLDTKEVQSYIMSARSQGVVEFLMNIIPNSIVGAFAQGEVIQVLFFSVLFGLALASLGDAGKPVIYALDQISHALFRMIGFIVKLAPIAAFGAFAFTIGKFGLGSLFSLGKLMACVYLSSLGFIFLGLGVVMKLNGVSLWRFLKYIREEILIVLGTSSSESAFPRLMVKMEALGCSKAVVGLILPAGYSFNLDGTSIYLSMAALFIAQATNTPLTLLQELTLLAVCLLTSKGAAAVTGGGFSIPHNCILSPGTSKPATCGHFKSGQFEVLYSYQIFCCKQAAYQFLYNFSRSH